MYHLSLSLSVSLSLSIYIYTYVRMYIYIYIHTYIIKNRNIFAGSLVLHRPCPALFFREAGGARRRSRRIRHATLW